MTQMYKAPIRETNHKLTKLARQSWRSKNAWAGLRRAGTLDVLGLRPPTRLYDQSGDPLSVGEIERIRL